MCWTTCVAYCINLKPTGKKNSINVSYDFDDIHYDYEWIIEGIRMTDDHCFKKNVDGVFQHHGNNDNITNSSLDVDLIAC